jgi:hypothetical protein
MKVFKFKNEATKKYYAIAAMSQDLAYEYLQEDVGTACYCVEEIPESEWDKKIIKVWEDNNFDKKPFKMTIRESIIGTEPQQIFSNDFSSF